ncbi:MAG: hypothetical protein ABR564_04950 [Candidatus Dormibacteria bacterium]
MTLTMTALTWDDLTEAEQRVWRAAEAGDRTSLEDTDSRQNHPDRGAEWAAPRQVRAAVLVQLVTGSGVGTPEVHPRGIRLQGARVTGELDLEGAALRCPLALLDCHVDSVINLTDASAPSLRLSGCRITGIMARELVVRGDLVLDDGFTATGEVRLAGARIGGDLNCRGGHFGNPSGPAIDGYALTVTQTLFCCDGFSSEGEVRLEGAHMGGALICSAGRFSGGAGPALRADLLSVDQGVLLNDGFVAEGEVRLIGAHIRGQLVCNGGRFLNPGGVAIGGGGLNVERGMLCQDGFEARGEVRLVGASIIAELNTTGGSFVNPGGCSLDLTRACLDGALFLRPDIFAGCLDLTHARIGGYYDDQATWPQELHVDGLTYDSIEAKPDIRVADRLRWLGMNNGGVYSSQPYEQLATAYRRQGLDGSAREVSIAKQRRRRMRGGALDHISGRLLDWTVGYGYRTWLAVGWLMALWAVGALVFWLAEHQGQMRAVRPDAQPPFQPLVYALDVLLPVVSLHQRDSWNAEGLYGGVFVLFTLAGWVLASAVVLSLSGMLKRD